MPLAIQNLVRSVGIPEAAALRMATSIPAKVAGLYGRMGRIGPGAMANFTVLDDAYDLVSVWVHGREMG